MDLTEYVIAVTTCPDQSVAAALAQGLLKQRLVACVNVLPGVRSLYWWQGTIQDESEVLLLMKTSRAFIGALETAVHAGHPYDVPEFLVLPVQAGSPEYLHWLGAELAEDPSGMM